MPSSPNHICKHLNICKAGHTAPCLPLLHTHIEYVFTVDPTDIDVNLSRCLQLLEKFHVWSQRIPWRRNKTCLTLSKRLQYTPAVNIGSCFFWAPLMSLESFSVNSVHFLNRYTRYIYSLHLFNHDVSVSGYFVCQDLILWWLLHSNTMEYSVHVRYDAQRSLKG